jgi:glycolate oxidase iron-sulfur subunit
MQTRFSPELLADPATAGSERVIRKCVHCGFCTATCPTYVILGDELDSPRGRIYLIKEMLERNETPSDEVVKHVDRCLSCLSCMTTCPSGVNYMHLVDHARAYIEERYRRPLIERVIRSALAWTLPHPARFRFMLNFARAGRPFAGVFARWRATRPLSAMLSLAPRELPAPATRQQVGEGTRGRVIMLQGCVEPVLRPAIREAAERVLARAGFAIEYAAGEACCGALVHHMGREAAALEAARRNIDAWAPLVEKGDVRAIVITASGCGTTLKNYGHMLKNDPAYAEKAEKVSSLARDITELLSEVDLPAQKPNGLKVAYHAACSLQHGQKVVDAPRKLLAAAGFEVRTPAESHLCCGSAGTYNLLQPDLAGQLGDRKAEALKVLDADVITTGNIGCAVQIGSRADTPVVHIAQLLDWASGGPAPDELAHLSGRMRPKETAQA